MTESKALTIRDRLQSPALMAELGKVLPKHLTPERMARVAMTAITRTPLLADADPASFFRCMLDLSAMGLEPDGRRAHLVPFRNNKRNCIEVQLMIDYKGLVELVYRSGCVANIHADVVRDGDLFVYDLGDVQHHVPHFLRRDADKPKDAGKVYAAYCRATLKDGTNKTEVLSLDEIEGIRKRSRAGQSGPWVTDWNEMAKKTAFRRVSKWLVLSPEIRDVVERDDDQYDLRGRVFTPAPNTSATVAAAAEAAAADLQRLLDRPAAEELLTPDEAAAQAAEGIVLDQTTAQVPTPPEPAKRGRPKKHPEQAESEADYDKQQAALFDAAPTNLEG
jgi:recombination protein RecT